MANILVLGGTRFFGKSLVHQLIKKGNDVTIATRGQTTDTFGNTVNRLKIDRLDQNSMKTALHNQSFDIVFDNICYSPDEVKDIAEVLSPNVKKYVFTSSMAVYKPNLGLIETAFNPYVYECRQGGRKDFSYGEGKRLAEAAFYQNTSLPVVAVRFPVVLGKEDYTKRLFFFCEKIINQEPFTFTEGDMSFILQEEAGDFLAWISETEYEGPINACSNGTIAIPEIITYIEKLTGKKALFSANGERSPYNGYTACTVSNEKATSLGFSFRNVEDYIYELLDGYVEEMKGKNR